MTENELLVDYPEFEQVINSHKGQSNVLKSLLPLEEEAERVAKVLARCTGILLADIQSATSDFALFEDVSSDLMLVFMFGIWRGQNKLAKL